MCGLQKGAWPAGGQPENAYMWEGFEPPLVDNCSVIRAVGAVNVFDSNHADMAGGAVYASEKAGLEMRCSNGLPWDDTRGCPTPNWDGNTAGVLDKQHRPSPLEHMLG